MRFFLLLCRYWVLLALVLLCGHIALNNQAVVPVNLPPLIQHISIDAYLAYAGFLFIGATLTVIFFGLDSVKKSFQIRKLSKQVEELKKEIEDKPLLSVNTGSEIAPLSDGELNPV
jgi:hypothetical protein